MATRQQILTTTASLQGAPYLHLGRSEAGIDCLGVAVVVGQRLGLLPDDIGIPAYSPAGMPRYLSVFFSYVDEIPIADVLPGDGYLLCHDPSKNTRPRHVMIRSEYGITGMALWKTVDKVCECRIDEGIQARIVKGWRYRGIED